MLLFVILVYYIKPNLGIFSIILDNYIKAIVRFLLDIKKLIVDLIEYAFSLLIYISKKVYANLNYGPKIYGFSNTNKLYKKID